MTPATKSLVARVAAAALGRLAGGRAVILLGLRRPPPGQGGDDRRTDNSLLKIELNFRR